MSNKITARIAPEGSLDLVSQHEVNLLKDRSNRGVYRLFRQCALAVLNCGNESDDPNTILAEFADFDIQLIQQARGIKLEVINAPHNAFVDGKMIKGIQEHLYAVLRDIIYANNVLSHNTQLNLNNGEDITNFIFHMLRNAGVLIPRRYPNIVVCWGGHSISRDEYDFTKEVGHSLGLRGLDICTGCGPGAMKGPMKGATIAHAKQRIQSGRYIGLTEPGIIAAESPNPIVNELVILPDIEKRLEAFVRLGHGIVVFPGGAGTAEEILYLLGILLNPENDSLPFPVIFAGAKKNEEYFGQINEFIGLTLGKAAQRRYRIIIDDPELVALEMKKGIQDVTYHRKGSSDAYYYNWLLKVQPEFQHPFQPTHESMRALALHREQPIHDLAANLRRAFSGIVSGNVKEEGVQLVERLGPFEISGDKTIVGSFGSLLESFVKQQRMKLPGSKYVPSYRIVD
ncbi:predicted Rossmann fold nucleotide-binding protein [Hahella chejuensis KCTC 2396]|uniref:AMP nucleosidase n=1 Tax=Hahella chejuensis (strain KCTC 2396) TaxID=349521 RepID=Q2SP72_HAHCH|nr:nucleotide 5'-monophosphate nucleosidase PpnN [Hahella chejuensis]ABC27552.1 predicted Rossmann fold nucleotide-binding protein [Hahella chejuensis KCTC 2396]